MKGIDIKAEIKRSGKSITEVAAAIGESQQNLNAAPTKDDIRTGLLERIAGVLGKPISYFYGEGNTATASGDGSTAVAGGTINDSILIEEIAAQRKLTALAMEQNSQLLRIIDNLTKR